MNLKKENGYVKIENIYSCIHGIAHAISYCMESERES